MVFAVVFLFFGLGCGPGQPTPATPAPAKPATEVATKAAWHQEWEKALVAAKQEGVVTISTLASPDQREVWRDGFKKAYGIEVEFITAAANAQLFERILTERRAGLYLRDIVMSGAGSYFTMLKPQGVLDPVKPQLLLPEVLDHKVWYGGSLPFLVGLRVCADEYRPG